MLHESRYQNPNLALVGMHGPPEATGPALLESVRASPIEGWDVELANEAAAEAGKRFMTYNMAVAFAKADATSNEYELRRPAELLELARNRKVIDIHDQPTNHGGYVMIGREGSPQMLSVALLLGIRAVIIVSHKRFIVGHIPDALVIEQVRGKSDQYVSQNVEKLRACMGAIARGAMPIVDVDYFDYYEQVTEIHTARAQALGLARKGHLEPFDEIPSETLALLEVETPEITRPGRYVADYWNGDSSSEDWFGNVLRKIPAPYSP